MNAGNWSPDGSQLAYAQPEEKPGKGVVVHPDGRGLHEIRGVEGAIDWLAWSANGETLYASAENKRAGITIWQVKAEGLQAAKLMDGQCVVADASTDGKRLLAMTFFGEESAGGSSASGDRAESTLESLVSTAIFVFQFDERWPNQTVIFGVGRHDDFRKGAEKLTWLFLDETICRVLPSTLLNLDSRQRGARHGDAHPNASLARQAATAI